MHSIIQITGSMIEADNEIRIISLSGMDYIKIKNLYY